MHQDRIRSAEADGAYLPSPSEVGSGLGRGVRSASAGLGGKVVSLDLNSATLAPLLVSILGNQRMMRLVGPLHSPYTRRVAISLQLMGLEFSHEKLSVRGDPEKFAAINPVKRAPTLVLDDGVVLMESSLILAYLERLVPPERSLMPQDIRDFARAQRIAALGLAACDKGVVVALEGAARPAEKRHQPVVDTALGQVHAAFRLLEAEIGGGSGWFFGSRVMQADITTAMAWRLSQHVMADSVTPAQFPKLSAFAARAEQLPEFVATRPA